MKNRNVLIFALFAFALSGVSLYFAACTGTPAQVQQTTATVESLQQATDATAAQVAALQAQAAAHPDDPAIAAALAKAEKQLSVAGKVLESYKANLAAATAAGPDPLAGVKAGIQTAQPYLPPPYDKYADLALLGLSVAGGIFGAIKSGQATKSTSAATALANIINPADPATAQAIQALTDHPAEAFIDAVHGVNTIANVDPSVARPAVAPKA